MIFAPLHNPFVPPVARWFSGRAFIELRIVPAFRLDPGGRDCQGMWLSLEASADLSIFSIRAACRMDQSRLDGGKPPPRQLNRFPDSAHALHLSLARTPGRVSKKVSFPTTRENSFRGGKHGFRLPVSPRFPEVIETILQTLSKTGTSFLVYDGRIG